MLNRNIIQNILASAKDLERLHHLEVLEKQENDFKFPRTQRPAVTVMLPHGAATLPVLGVRYNPLDWDQDLTIYLLDAGEDSPEDGEVIAVNETELLPGELLRITELIPDERIDIDVLKPVFESLAGSYALGDGTSVIVDPVNEKITTDVGIDETLGIEAYRFVQKAAERMKSGMDKDRAVTETALKDYGYDIPF